MMMGQKREGIVRAYLNGWGRTRRKEARIDRARRKEAVRREVEISNGHWRRQA